MKLEKELAIHGCDMDPETFVDTLADVFAEMCPGQTVDELLCDWRRQRDYCKRARYKVGMRPTGDILIMKALLNRRKQGNHGMGVRERMAASA